MSFFDFFFPEVAQASHLRSIAETQRLESVHAANQRFREERERRWDAAHERNLEQRVDELERDLGQAGLIIEALLQALEENGTLKREDIAQRAAAVDAGDGVTDGRVTRRSKPFLPNRKWDDAK
jgi:predicted Holliday junction resolvase-like endonuclease